MGREDINEGCGDIQINKGHEESDEDFPKYPLGYGASQSNECFIATAVYGNPNALEVRIIRDFGNNVLKKNIFGKRAFNLYYGGFGKRAAEFIKNHFSFSIPVIKKGLDCFVQYYKS